MELLVTMVVTVILGAAVTKFYKDSYRTYSLQEQVADRNQNAHFILNKFVEIMQQAGMTLPDTGWPVIKQAPGVVTIGSNPREGFHFEGLNPPSQQFISVIDASPFIASANSMLNTPYVLVDYADPARPTAKIKIQTNYNLLGFKNGVKDNPTGLDSIYVVNAVDLNVGDKIYGYREDQYLLSGSDLVMRPDGVAGSDMVLAENIDSLGMTFRTAAGTATTNWALMRSVSITVRARTQRADPRLPKPGYRKITLPMNVILRNKV